MITFILNLPDLHCLACSELIICPTRLVLAKVCVISKKSRVQVILLTKILAFGHRFLSMFKTLWIYWKSRVLPQILVLVCFMLSSNNISSELGVLERAFDIRRENELPLLL